MYKMPLVEVRLCSDGFLVRESLTQSFKIDHPVKKISTPEQWRLIYDDLLTFDVREGSLEGFFSYVQDPLMMLHHLLQRAADEELQTRGCVCTQYPV